MEIQNMNKFRILVVARKLDSEGGGSNKSLKLLLNGLQKRGHTVKLATVNSEKNNIKEKLECVEVEEYHVKRERIKEIQSTKNILTNNENFDIAHIFNPGLLLGGGIYRRRGSLPVVGRLNHYTPFCTNPDRMTEDCFVNCSIKKKMKHDRCKKSERIFRIPEYIARTDLVPRLVNQLDSLFALSPAVKHVFEQNGFENIHVVPNQIDQSLKLNNSENSLFNGSDRNILFVGRLRKKKGVEYLIQAAELAESRFSLHIVGDGKEKDRLTNLVENKSIENKVTFYGWIQNENLPQFYRSSDVFVHPCVWPEPFGRTVLEALQFDTPSIVSNVGGPPWIAGDAGLTFEPRNAQSLANQIDMFFSNMKLRENLISNCSERKSNFSSHKIIKKIEEIYAEIIQV